MGRRKGPVGRRPRMECIETNQSDSNFTELLPTATNAGTAGGFALWIAANTAVYIGAT